MSEALYAQGTKLYINISDAWVEVPECRKVMPPEAQSTFVEVTHLNSPNNDDEYIKGLNRKGNASFECPYLPQNAVIKKLYELRDAVGVLGKTQALIEFPDDAQSMIYFDTFVESLQTSAQTGGDLALTGSLKPTGTLHRFQGGHALIDPTDLTHS